MVSFGISQSRWTGACTSLPVNMKLRCLKMNLLSNLFCVSLVLFVSACISSPELELRLNPTNQTEVESETGDETGRIFGEPNPDGKNDDNDNTGNRDPEACAENSAHTESFDLQTAGVSGANVVFLIDESGSMRDEFAKVGQNLSNFVTTIEADANNNYRILFVYNSSLLSDAALDEAVSQNDSVNRVNSETWSKWSDMAFFRAFAKPSFVQNVSMPFPLDLPIFRGFSQAEVMTQDDCDVNDYFRPRQTPDYWRYANFRRTPACITPAMFKNLEDYLLPDIAVNIVSISDDDLNVSWDRQGFSFDDPTLNAYPEVVDAMFRQVLGESGLNSNYLFHSIVGLNANDQGVEEYGESHLALSRRTAGATFDLTQEDWSPLFAELTERVIFSEQSGDLSCKPQQVGAAVKLNGRLLEPQTYVLRTAEKELQLLPEAFSGLADGMTITVEITYRSAGL